MADEPLVWLPFESPSSGTRRRGCATRRWCRPATTCPDSVDEVEFYVPSYELGPEQGEVFSRMSRLKVVQTMTAGVDHIRSQIPEGVLLCNGRGIHNASTAELALTLTLASLRGIPGFVEDQRERNWNQGWRTALADKTVLIVGYGDIGRDIERRMVPFEVDVLRVARTARDGVHALDALPDLLPRADVVVLIIPGTSETKGLVDAGFLAAMKHGALLVNVARGTVVVTDDLLPPSRRAGCTPRSTSPTRSRCPRTTRCGRRPNVLITPHVGGATPAMWPRAYRLVREQLERFAKGDLLNVMTGEY